jgi:hypothetical protein
VGVLKGQDVDLGTTIAGAPNPSANPYDDWLYWSQYTANSGSGSGAGYFPGGTGSSEYVDIKAKRRLEDLQESFNLVFMATQASTFPVTGHYSASTLLMLP